MEKLAELTDGPALGTFDDMGRAGEADDETLYYRASNSLPAFHLNISNN
jgi:hypothetical protein